MTKYHYTFYTREPLEHSLYSNLDTVCVCSLISMDSLIHSHCLRPLDGKTGALYVVAAIHGFAALNRKFLHKSTGMATVHPRRQAGSFRRHGFIPADESSIGPHRSGRRLRDSLPQPADAGRTGPDHRQRSGTQLVRQPGNSGASTRRVSRRQSHSGVRGGSRPVRQRPAALAGHRVPVDVMAACANHSSYGGGLVSGRSFKTADTSR